MNNTSRLHLYKKLAGHKNETLQIMGRRMIRHSKPGVRTDNFKLALVIEGGGMRGIVAAGMVTMLSRLGFRDVFDVVYGTSAGALTGAYFLSNQADFGTSIYYQDLLGSEWISRKRFLRGGPFLNLDYLFDVMQTKKTLDTDAFFASNIPLKAVATDIDGYQTAVLQAHDRESLFGILRASASVPLVSGKPFKIGDKQYVDGCLKAPIPIEQAFSDGATHVMVLLTRPEGENIHAHAFVDKRIIAPSMNRSLKGLGDVQLASITQYGQILSEIRIKRTSSRNLFAVALPKGVKMLSHIEQKAERLTLAGLAGEKTMCEAMGGDFMKFKALEALSALQ